MCCYVVARVCMGGGWGGGGGWQGVAMQLPRFSVCF